MNLEEKLLFWKTQLKNLPPNHGLPIDKPRIAERNISKLHRQTINRDLTRKIEDYCRQHGTSIFVFVQSAFSILLNRYRHEPDTVLGIASFDPSGTNDGQAIAIEHTIIRNDLSKNISFVELLEQTGKLFINATNYYLPYPTLVAQLNIEKSLYSRPLFQTLLSAGIETNNELPNHANTREPSFDLWLNLVEKEELSLSWRGNENLFFHETIKRFSENFAVLLKEIVVKPARKINNLQILSESERQKLLFEWNEGQPDNYSSGWNQNSLNEGLCIDELFEMTVRKAPDNIAVICGKEQLTYAELNRKVNQLAHYLIENGVKFNTLVGICVERSLAMIISIMGVLKARGAYVPLDPDYPKARLEYMIDDSLVDIIITQRSLLPILPPKKIHTVCMDDPSTQSELKKRGINDPTIKPSSRHSKHRAYVIYTSGSTGKPKGVAIFHSGVTNLINWYSNAFSMSDNDRILIMSAFGFDLAQKNFFAPLASGATIILPDTKLFDVERFVSIIKNQHITWINTGPSLLYPLAQINWISTFKAIFCKKTQKIA